MNCPNCNHPQDQHGPNGCYHVDTIGIYPDDHMICCYCETSSHEITIAALTAQNKELLAGLELTFRSLCAYMDYSPRHMTESCYDPDGAIERARALLAKYGGNNA